MNKTKFNNIFVKPLEEFYKKTVSPETITIYFSALGFYNSNILGDSLQKIYKTNNRFPNVRQCLKICKETKAEYYRALNPTGSSNKILNPMDYLQKNYSNFLEKAKQNAKLSYILHYFNIETDGSFKRITSNFIDNFVQRSNPNYEHPTDLLYRKLANTQGIKNKKMIEDAQDMVYQVYLIYLKFYNKDIINYHLKYEQATPIHNNKKQGA